MIGHALSDQCELPRRMDFNGNTWKRTHLEPQRKSDIDKTCPELSKLLDSDHLDGEIAAKSQTAVQVLPTSVQKVIRSESDSMEWTSSSDVNSDQRHEGTESSHTNQVTCHGTSSSTQSLHEDQVLNDDVSSRTQSLHGVQATSADPSSSTQSLNGVQATSDDPSSSTQSLHGVAVMHGDLSLSTQSLHGVQVMNDDPSLSKQSVYGHQVMNDDPSPSTPHGGQDTVDGTSCSTLSWHANQDKNDGMSSSTHSSSHPNQTSDKPEKSSSVSVMPKTFSDSGGTQIVSSNSRRKTRPQHATKKCQMTEISDGPQSNKENTSSIPASPIELQMSCSEDDLDESQLDVKNQYLAAMMEHKAQMEKYVNEMEQYFLEKHGLNNKKEAASSVSEPDVLINISRGVQATPVVASEKDIHINPALELDLSSSGSNKSSDGDNYKHEIDEGSLLVSNASPVVIPTTQTRMHLTNSTPRNRFQRTISPLTSTSAISKSVSDSPGTQVLAELEKVCKNIPSVSKRSTPPVLTSELEIPTPAQVKTVVTGQFGSPHQSDMTTTQHNHPLLSPPVGIMQSSAHVNLPQLVQMSDQATGRALPLYQQHRGGKRLYPSSSNSPGSSTSTRHQSPDNIGRVPDQGTPRYPAFFQLFRGVRPYHQPYPPAVRFPGSSCSNVQSNVRFPEPNTARFPEPNTAMFPEPNTAMYPEPNTARFPEPNGMRFPFPHYRAPGRAQNHMYPAGTGSVGIAEPNVHPFSSGVLASRRRRQSSGSKQSASPPVSAPHNINVSQSSHTIKYKPQDSVASHFERTYQEIMLRQNNYPRSPNVTVRHPWQQVPLSSAGIRPGLQPPQRNSYLRDQLTTPSRWPYNQRPIAQNFPPRIRQPSSYSHLINGNTRGTSFNQQTPSGNSDWVNCLSTNNKTMEARPSPSTVPGSFDHQQQAVRSHSQPGSQSASPPSQLPSPMNHMPPENHFQPSHVPLTRHPVRNLHHVPPLISVAEPISHTPVAATALRHSPKVPARTENLPSIYSYLAQNNAQSVMPQIASIQGVPSAQDPASNGGAVHPNRHQEPVMPRITRVHSTEMVTPDDEMVLDLSHRDKRTVMPQISQVRSQSEKSNSFGISQTLEQSDDPVPMMPKIVTVRTENGSATYQDGGTIPEGITSFREDQQNNSGSKTQEMLPGSNPALMIPSVSIRRTHDDNVNGSAPISRDLSTLPCNVDLVSTYTPDLPNSGSENILSIPKLTGRARVFPMDEPTSGHLAPGHSFTDAKVVSNDGKHRSHSRKRKRKKHEDKTKPKKKKSYHHHHHDHAEAKSNHPAVLKIPNVRKALREQSASGIVLHEWSMNQVREERNSLTSSKASSDDRESSAPEDLSNSSVKELQTNPSGHHESASVNNVSSSMTVQAAPENLNVASNQIASLPSAVPSSVSLAVVPTSLQVSTTPVEQACLRTIAPKQPLILQGLLAPQIVVPSNITLIKQNNIVMGPILQVSISNQISQNFSILSSDQTPKTCAEVSNMEKGERSNEEKNAKTLDVANAVSSVEGTKKVGSQKNNLTIECYEENLEETANVDSSTTGETSLDNEEVTITLPIPEASKPPESESQQTDDQGKHLTQAGEEVNLFDRVATYMSNLEKENDKARKSNPKPTKVTASASLIKAGERLAKTSGLKKGDGQQTSVRLKNCTLRLVPRKQRDDTVAGKTNRGKQERVWQSREPPTAKDKAEAAKWDKYYGFREGRLPQHQHNTRFRIVCYHCENMMSDNVTYMDHVESVIEKSCPASKIKQLCKICFQTQTTGMAKHIVDCHPVDGKFCCKICNIHFPLRKDFKFHMKRVHKGLTMPYVCKICLYQTSFHSDLRQHFISKHRGSKALLCHFCTKILYSSRSYLAHFTKHYARESGVSCPNCILLFLSNSACKEHLANDHQMLELKESDGRPKLEVCQPQRKANSADKPSREVTKRISPKTVEVIEIPEIEEEEVNKTWKCLECGGTYSHLEEHLITEYCCQNCRYYTQCSSAYTQHVVSFHSSFQDAPILHPVKKSQVFGGHLLKCRKCDFKTSFATNMAEHIVCCPKGVSVLDSFAYLRKKALDEIALRGKLGKIDDDGEPDVISVDMLID